MFNPYARFVPAGNDHKRNSHIGHTTALLFGFLLLVPVFCRAEIVKGPILLRIDKDKAALMWEATTAGDDEVQYGSDGLDLTVTSKPIAVLDRRGNATVTCYVHKVWLTNLEPGSTCNYRIISGGNTSPQYRFRTLQQNPGIIRFAVYGDCRTHPRTHRQIIEQIIKANVDFVINDGDLVATGSQYEDWSRQFFDPVRGLAESVCIYPVRGNHDTGTFFDKFFVVDGQDNYPFAVANTWFFLGDNTSDGLSTAKLIDIIAADKRKTDADWRFAIWHEPNLNICAHMSDRGYPDALGRLLDNNMDFVLSGHSHAYERFRPITNKDIPHALTCMTIGGGGADLADIQPDYLLSSAHKLHHFCLFEIRGPKLSMKTIDIDGNVIDEIQIEKNTDKLNDEYLRSAAPLQAVLDHQKIIHALSAYTHTKPKANETFEATLKISPFDTDAPITFTAKPVSPSDNCKCSPAQSVTMKSDSDETKLRFTVISKTNTDLTYKKHLDPPLYIYCEYTTKYGKAWTSAPVEYIK
jgi:predicted phosphodiesterase